MSAQGSDRSGVGADARTDASGDTDGSRRGRMAVTALGGTLLALGVRRRSLAGAAMAFVGGWLAYRGVRGGGRERGDRSLADQSPGADAAAEHERVQDPDREQGSEAPSFERSITVDRSADELYELWRDPAEMDRIFGDAVSVTSAGENRFHWRVAGPLGQSVEWDAEIVADKPGEFLRWESVEGAVLPNAGAVGFQPAPADRGTEVTLTLDFDPPGGQVGSAAMSALGVVPKSLAGTALDRFKSHVETGEIPTLDRNPSGRGAGDLV